LLITVVLWFKAAMNVYRPSLAVVPDACNSSWQLRDGSGRLPNKFHNHRYYHHHAVPKSDVFGTMFAQFLSQSSSVEKASFWLR